MTSTPLTARTLSSVYQPGLDGLRGVAVMMVVMFHVTLYTPLPSAALLPVIAIVNHGWAGVDLFFVLSGFLITGILFDSRGTRRPLFNFYMRRVLRIFPLYYGVLTLVFVVSPLLLTSRTPRSAELFANQAWLWAYASNIAMTLQHRTLFNGEWLWLDHLWSLSVEEHFYLAWPLLVLTLSRRALIGVCVAAIPVAFGFRLWLLLAGNPLGGYMFTPCRIDGLAIGALLALLLRGPGGYSALRSVPLCGAVAASILAPLLYWRFHPPLTFNDPIVELFGYPLIAVCSAGLIALVVTRSNERWVGRLFSQPVLRTIGRYSYGIYVFHMLLQPLCLRFASARILSHRLGSAWLGLAAHLGLMIGLSIGVAALSYHVYERRFLDLRRFFGGTIDTGSERE